MVAEETAIVVRNRDRTDRAQASSSFATGGAVPLGYQYGVEGRALDGWWLAGSQSKVWATMLGKVGPPVASTGCGLAGSGPALEGQSGERRPEHESGGGGGGRHCPSSVGREAGPWLKPLSILQCLLQLILVPVWAQQLPSKGRGHRAGSAPREEACSLP